MRQFRWLALEIAIGGCDQFERSHRRRWITGRLNMWYDRAKKVRNIDMAALDARVSSYEMQTLIRMAIIPERETHSTMGSEGKRQIDNKDACRSNRSRARHPKHIQRIRGGCQGKTVQLPQHTHQLSAPLASNPAQQQHPIGGCSAHQKRKVIMVDSESTKETPSE